MDHAIGNSYSELFCPIVLSITQFCEDDMETTQVTQPFFIRVVKRFIQVAFVCLLSVSFLVVCVAIGRHVDSAKNAVSVKWVSIKYDIAKELDLVPHQISAARGDSKAAIVSLVKLYSTKYGINDVVGLSVIDQETLMGQYRHRYEETWERQYSRDVPCPNSWNREECKLLYSSVGAMQISYPIWKDFCGVTHPIELFDLDTNIECGIKILTHCMFEHRNISDNGSLVRMCVRKFNGAGPAAERYADEVMLRMADHVIADKDLLFLQVSEDRELVNNEPEQNQG